MRINRSLLGWGAFFIILGAVPLAVRGNLVSGDLVAQWPSLWPVILVGWGLGLVLRRTPVEWIGGAITAVTFGVMGGGLIATGFGSIGAFTACSDTGGSTAFQARSGTVESGASIQVDLPCGQLDMQGGDGTEWRIEGRDANGDGPNIRADSGQVRIDSDWPGRARTLFDPKTEWHLTIPRGPSLDLGVTINAGAGTIDLGGTTVGTASFTLNAGEIRLDGSNAVRVDHVSGTINAGTGRILLGGGTSLGVTINAGSLDVCVPAGSALRVHATSTLGSHNLDSLGLTKTGGNTWTTSGIDGATEIIELSVTTNAGSFNLEVGGSCGA